MLSFILNYWIEILFSLIVTVITFIYRKISKYVKKNRHTKRRSMSKFKNAYYRKI